MDTWARTCDSNKNKTKHDTKKKKKKKQKKKKKNTKKKKNKKKKKKKQKKKKKEKTLKCTKIAFNSCKEYLSKGPSNTTTLTANRPRLNILPSSLLGPAPGCQA